MTTANSDPAKSVGISVMPTVSWVRVAATTSPLIDVLSLVVKSMIKFTPESCASNPEPVTVNCAALLRSELFELASVGDSAKMV